MNIPYRICMRWFSGGYWVKRSSSGCLRARGLFYVRSGMSFKAPLQGSELPWRGVCIHPVVFAKICGEWGDARCGLLFYTALNRHQFESPITVWPQSPLGKRLSYEYVGLHPRNTVIRLGMGYQSSAISLAWQQPSSPDTLVHPLKLVAFSQLISGNAGSFAPSPNPILIALQHYYILL